jgi:hypothetical protein
MTSRKLGGKGILDRVNGDMWYRMSIAVLRWWISLTLEASIPIGSKVYISRV